MNFFVALIIRHLSKFDDSGRKTKSKEAAKLRRGKENEEFKDLSNLLPFHREIIDQLDKASIIRLTISFLKLRKFYSESKLHSSSKCSGFIIKINYKI